MKNTKKNNIDYLDIYKDAVCFFINICIIETNKCDKNDKVKNKKKQKKSNLKK